MEARCRECRVCWDVFDYGVSGTSRSSMCPKHVAEYDAVYDRLEAQDDLAPDAPGFVLLQLTA